MEFSISVSMLEWCGLVPVQYQCGIPQSLLSSYYAPFTTHVSSDIMTCRGCPTVVQNSSVIKPLNILMNIDYSACL